MTGGAGVTINTGDNTKFDVDVQGYIVDPATGVKTDVTVTQVGISPTFMGSQNETYVLVDITGAVVQQDTPPTLDQLSTHLTHWVVVHTGGVIDIINELEWSSEQIGDQFSQLCDILEPLKKGLDITEGTTGLRLTREEGRIFKIGIGSTATNKSTKDFPTASDFSFQYRTSDGTQYPVTQDIDNQQFESSPGVLSTVSTASTVTAQPLYIFPSGNIVAQYGQYEYATMQDALEGVAKDDFIKEGNIERNGVLLGWVVTKKAASDWSNSNDYVIISTNITNNYGQGGGATLDYDVVSDVTAGAIDPSDVVTQGTSFTDFVVQLLTKTFYPTYNAPTFSGSTPKKEVGTSTIPITMQYSQGSIVGATQGGVWNPTAYQGDRAGARNKVWVDGVDNGLSLTATVNQLTTLGNNSIPISLDHDAGDQPVDSTGANYQSPLPAGSLSSNVNWNGFYYRTAISGSNAPTANDIRNNYTTRRDSGGVINLASGTTATRFDVFVPQGSTIVSAIDEGNLNLDITSEFQQQADFSGLDANGDVVMYKHYLRQVGNPYTASSNLKITVT